MTVAGEFKTPTVQPSTPNLRQPAELFAAGLQVAKEKKSTLTSVVEGLGQGLALSQSIQQIQMNELDMRQKEVNIEKTKQVTAQLNKQLEEERDILEVLNMEDGPDKVHAIMGIPTKYSPKAVASSAPAVQASLNGMRNSSPQMAALLKESGAIDTWFPEEAKAERTQRDMLERIRAQGDQSVRVAEFRAQNPAASRASGGLTAKQQFDIEQTKRKTRDKELSNVYAPLRDTIEVTVPAKSRGRRAEERHTAQKIRAKAILQELEAGRNAIERSAEDAQGAPFIFKGKKFTDRRAAHTFWLNEMARKAGVPGNLDPYGMTGRPTAIELDEGLTDQEAAETQVLSEDIIMSTVKPAPTPAPEGMERRATGEGAPSPLPTPEDVVVTPGGVEVRQELFNNQVQKEYRKLLRIAKQAGRKPPSTSAQRRALMERARQNAKRAFDESAQATAGLL